MDVRCFTVGPLQENSWIVRRDGDRALLIDPGDEARPADRRHRAG